jgi:hypothetical protein
LYIPESIPCLFRKFPTWFISAQTQLQVQPFQCEADSTIWSPPIPWTVIPWTSAESGFTGRAASCHSHNHVIREYEVQYFNCWRTSVYVSVPGTSQKHHYCVICWPKNKNLQFNILSRSLNNTNKL